MEGGADLGASDLEAEVEVADVSALVDESVRVLFLQKVLKHTAFRHQPEQVVVAAKEDVQAHLDVVASRDDPRRDFATDKGARLENLDLVALVEELDGRGETGEARSDDGDLQLGGVLESEERGGVRVGLRGKRRRKSGVREVEQRKEDSERRKVEATFAR